MDDYMEQSRRLKIIRATLGLRQEEIAQKLGIKQGTYSGYEAGKQKLSLPIRERLIYTLKVSPLYIDDGISLAILSDNATVKDRIAYLMTHYHLNMKTLNI